jgi:hypothetical protein
MSFTKLHRPAVFSALFSFVGPDGVLGKLLKLGGEAMTPFLVRLLEVSLNNATIQNK